MENVEVQNSEEMQPSETNSETARLVSPNHGPKTSYINLTNNLCAVIFVGTITYCCFKDGVSLFSFHPTLMALGWIVVMTTAINAITPGDFATEWMPIRLRSARHWVIQLCGGIILSVGFVIIVSNKFINGFPHFITLHAKFGLASIIFMFITMLGGVGALYSLKLKHYMAPLYTKLIHATVGLITFTLGIITIILAFFSKWWDQQNFGDILRYINISLILSVMIFTILRPSLKIYFRLKERLENIN